jgi:osmotically-inducible protein OsmY
MGADSRSSRDQIGSRTTLACCLGFGNALPIVKRDSELRDQVLQELKWDTRIDEADVGVSVHDGVVTLSGTVGSYAERLAAQDAAHRVAGVRDVANEIQVRLPRSHVRTDEDIARAIRHALEWNVMVPADAINSTVANGWVTLEGFVTSWRHRVDAETAIRYLPGVKGIANKLLIRGPEVDSTSIRRAIEQALERRAEREARHLKITVDGSTVTIAGKVRNWPDLQAVLGTVEHAPGVHEVKDKLEIDPSV